MFTAGVSLQMPAARRFQTICSSEAVPSTIAPSTT